MNAIPTATLRRNMEFLRVAWSPSEPIFATYQPGGDPTVVDASPELTIWDAAKGQVLQRLTSTGAGNGPDRGGVRAVAWHPNGDAIIAGSGYGQMFMASTFVGNEVRRWRVSDGKALGATAGHTPEANGRHWAAVTGHPWRHRDGSTTTIYDANDRELITVDGAFVAWTPGGFATEDPDYSGINQQEGESTHRLWQLPSGKRLAQLELPVDPVLYLPGTTRLAQLYLERQSG